MLLIIAVITISIGYFIYQRHKWQTLPPGPWGLPILGYLPFLDKKQPHVSLTKLTEKYGPIYSISMGSVLTIVLSDYKLVREAFSKDEFSGRAPLFLTHGIMDGNGIICAEGPLWKDQRKLVTIWLKNYCRSASRLEVDKKISDSMTTLFEEISREKCQPIDLAAKLTNTLGQIVNDLICGCTFPTGDPTWEWLRAVQEEGCREMGVAAVVNFLPFLRFFSSSVNKTMDFIKRGQNQTHRVYAKIIAMRRRLLDLPQPSGSEYELHKNLHKEHPDGLVKCLKFSKHSSCTEEHYFDPQVLKFSTDECILDHFLREQRKRFDENDANAMFMNDKQLLYLLADLFGAGLDTTSVTLSWFLLYMALYPDEQDAIRKEVSEQCPNEGCVVDSSRCPRLMASLCEVQRIRSIVPVGIPHGCVKDCELGGYRIPKGAMIMVLQWALHMDPAVWKDPDHFNPSRFLSPNGTVLKPPEFMPFQTGKRMCPGDELSRILSAGVVARLLLRWRVRACAPPADLRGRVGLTLGPSLVLYWCEPVAD